MGEGRSRKRRNQSNGAEADRREECPPELMQGYTPSQREAFQTGLRILAKVAARVHMRREAVEHDTEQDTGEEVSE